MKPPVSRTELHLQGLPASPGIAIGPALCFRRRVPTVEHNVVSPENVETEIQRFQVAIDRSVRELKKIKQSALDRIGRQASAIFDAQLMMITDEALRRAVEHSVRNNYLDAENATLAAFEKLETALVDSADAVFRERAGDVLDLKQRVVRNLQQARLVSKFHGEAVVVAESLSPADTIVLTRNTVLGFVMDGGGLTSHAVILARSMGIPAVIGVRTALSSTSQDSVVIVDGDTGDIVIDPSPATLAEYEEKRERNRQLTARLGEIAGLPTETRDGHPMILAANVDRIEDIALARHAGAQGIGLVRTEMQLANHSGFPSENTQFELYRTLAERMHPHWVTIRVFDIGADKPFLPLQHREPNPALGSRGIRLLLENRDVFRTQLRAMVRASRHRNVRILLPMISRLDEVRQTRELLEEVMRDLRKHGEQFDEHIPLGVMIEVPSAALMARELARESDFLSIGTNDLVQYTLAVDRTNESLAHLYDEFHPAIIRLIRDIVLAGHAEETPVAICGELAGNPLATVLLAGLGVDELSVSPARLLPVKNAIRNLTMPDAERVARAVLAMHSSTHIRALLTEWRTDNERAQLAK